MELAARCWPEHLSNTIRNQWNKWMTNESEWREQRMMMKRKLQSKWFIIHMDGEIDHSINSINN